MPVHQIVTSGALPWAKPPRELLLVSLVAITVLVPVYEVSTQDISHFCAARAVASGHLAIGACADGTVDIASYNGRIYSNKAPGMFLLALPAVEAVQLPTATRWEHDGDLRLWLVRLLTSGIAFVFCAFVLGRLAEGVCSGTGALVAVTFGLGTLAAPFAATGFDHLPAAALAFAAFVCAWARRPAVAGVAAGVAYA